MRTTKTRSPNSLRTIACRWSGSILLSHSFCGRDDDVAVVHGTVIALEQQRPGVPFGAVERAAGKSRNLPVADDGCAVQLERQHPAHERDVHRLPLARSLSHVLARRNEAVESAEMM